MERSRQRGFLWFPTRGRVRVRVRVRLSERRQHVVGEEGDVVGVGEAGVVLLPRWSAEGPMIALGVSLLGVGRASGRLLSVPKP
jgi:hypothetical protein